MTPITAEVYIALVDGRYRCYRTPDGRTRDYFGPAFDTVWGVRHYAAMVEGKPPVISPLRG